MYQLHYEQPPFPRELIGVFMSMTSFMRLIDCESVTLMEESATGPDDVASLNEWAALVILQWPDITATHHSYTYPGERNMTGTWSITKI